MYPLLEEYINWSEPMSSDILKEYHNDGEFYYLWSLRYGLDEDLKKLTDKEKEILHKTDSKIAAHFDEKLFKTLGKNYDEELLRKWWGRKKTFDK